MVTTRAINRCAFCGKPKAELRQVRDEGNLMMTGKTTFELACIGCRWKYGLQLREELERKAKR